ncbi:uncharacterized protein LOC121836681 [Ixodes scapularis]|uniref:uncharacterized protein LOC121836681 n=1 Tax=Ixodes scapularis TaxID=6945 RepID=UPI001C392FFA|nr:uncharacterized protein LOC121836681 [Ixodes scapularis]
MPLINWEEATAAELSGFTADLIREELGRRQLDNTGNKEEIIERLLINIAETKPLPEANAHGVLPSDSTSAGQPGTSTMPTFTADPVLNMQLLTAYLQQSLQIPARSVNVTTLPDLSSTISTFSGDGGISARRWLEDLERTQQLASWEPSTLLAIALGKLRGPAADWKVTTGKQFKTWPEWKEAFQAQFGEQLSLIQWQTRVAARQQAQGESLVNYTLAKLKIIARCPVTLTDQQRLEYVIQGLRDRQIATAIAVQRPSTVPLFMTIVTDLDRTLDHNRRQDLATAICYNCQNPGHLANKCPLPRKSRTPNQVTPSTQPNATAFSTYSPEELPGSKFACMIVPVTVAGVGPVDAFPDSGSKMSIISLRLVSHLNLLPWSKPPLVVVGGGSVTPIGSVCIRISVGPISGLVEAAVLPQNALPLILGEDWFCASQVELLVRPPLPSQLRHPGNNIIIDCQERLLPRMANAVLLENSALSKSRMPCAPDGLQTSPIFPEEQPAWSLLGLTAMHITSCQEPQTSAILPQPAVIGTQLLPDDRNRVQAILERHALLFATSDHDLGLYDKVEHTIDLVQGAQPYSRQPYRCTSDDRSFIEEQTAQLLQKGIIVPSIGPWGFPVVVVTRENKKRLCVNYIPLNKLTISVVQPLPLADDLMNDVAGCCLFASLDLNFAEFLDLLEEVLTLLLHSGLKVSLTKCKFGVESIRFLGFILSSQGKLPDPAKVEALNRIPTPQTPKAVLSWAQTAGFYRRFIKDFAKVTAPLQSIIRSGLFEWTPACESAFKKIRHSLTSAPILAYFDPAAPTTLATDASGVGLGAVLTQMQNGREVVIEYASRTLSTHEQPLHSNVWECIAAHWAITQKFRQYLIGLKFCLITDNWTVACLTSSLKPSRRFTGMLMDLTEFDFTVQHRPGRQNVVADMLSRLSCATVTPTAALADMQREDSDCSVIRQQLTSSGDANDEYLVLDDVLYRRLSADLSVIVVPAKMRQHVLELCHDGSGHMDLTRTLAKVECRYWWPRMSATVSQYVESCLTCQLNNRPTTKSVGLMGSMPTTEQPFSIIAMDHISMCSADSSKYILNVIDFATRYIVPVAVATTSASEVIRHLREVFHVYGAPDHCLTDHGRAFESRQFLRFMAHHGVTMHYSVAYRAASNGLVERNNATLVAVLRKLCGAQPETWEGKLTQAAFAVNTAFNASLQFSPFELLYGYTPKLPRQRHCPVNTTSLEDRLLNLCANRSQASANAENARDGRCQRYDRTHREQQHFHPGQLVWLRRQEPVTTTCEKMAPRFKGPYQILELKTPTTYLLQRVSYSDDGVSRTATDTKVAHASQIKPFHHPYVDETLLEPSGESPPDSQDALLERDSQMVSPAHPEDTQNDSHLTSPDSIDPVAEDQTPLARSDRARRPPSWLRDFLSD